LWVRIVLISRLIFILKAADLRRHRAGDGVDLVHQVGSLPCILGHFRDVGGDLPGAGRGF